MNKQKMIAKHFTILCISMSIESNVEIKAKNDEKTKQKENPQKILKIVNIRIFTGNVSQIMFNLVHV